MEVILYSSGCPKCEILKKKLDNSGIDYQYIEDEQLMIDMGFKDAPQLKVDENILNFSQAIKFLKSVQEEIDGE